MGSTIRHLVTVRDLLELVYESKGLTIDSRILGRSDNGDTLLIGVGVRATPQHDIEIEFDSAERPKA